MKLAFVDQQAVQGRTFLHRAEPWSKVVSTVFLIAGIIFCTRWELLIPLFLLFFIALWFLGLSPARQFYYYLYPFFFSLLYGYFLAGLQGTELTILLLRAVSAVMTLLMLMMTTPYTDVFSVLNRVLPSILTDVMFLTYRAFFLLLGRLQELMVAIKLRGGGSTANLFRNLAGAGTYLGLAFMNAIDLNERSYWALLLRGYQGGLEGTAVSSAGKLGGALLLVSLSFFLAAVIW